MVLAKRHFCHVSIFLYLFVLYTNCSSRINTDINVKYKFSSNPWAFKVSPDGEFYISDNNEIICFNKKGELLSAIRLDSLNTDITPIFDFIPINQNSFIISSRGKVFKWENGLINILDNKNNESIKLDKCGTIFSTYHKYKTEENLTYNGFRIINRNKVLNYPENYSYDNLNFEIINEKILFYTSDNYLFKLPIDTSKEIVKEQIPLLKGLNDRIWFLGVVNDHYVFKYNDYKNNKQDVIYYFTDNLKFSKKLYIDFNDKDRALSLNNDQEMNYENPSGLLYAFDNKAAVIYVLKNTNEGLFINNLENITYTEPKQ
jgi:hypothetical protein